MKIIPDFKIRYDKNTARTSYNGRTIPCHKCGRIVCHCSIKEQNEKDTENKR